MFEQVQVSLFCRAASITEDVKKIGHTTAPLQIEPKMRQEKKNIEITSGFGKQDGRPSALVPYPNIMLTPISVQRQAFDFNSSRHNLPLCMHDQTSVR
jgi:hypothetical protein